MSVYGLLLLIIAALLGTGAVIGGARRWFTVFGFSFQPSEFMKPVIVLVIAYLVRVKRPEPTPLGVRDIGLPIAAALVPAALVVLQPDLGTAIMILLTALAMLWFVRLKKGIYALFLLVGVVSPVVSWTWVLRPYQEARILNFLKSLWQTSGQMDLQGIDYHAKQAMIAIGSGGFLGKGYMRGTQYRLRFVPEHHTDFIFTVFAEEWGFIGCIVLFLLFISLTWRIVDISKKAGDPLGSAVAFGLGSTIFFQFAINLLMTMQWAPIVGVPLPLFSYGGSSLVSTLISVGIILNIHRRRFR
jgi:rod shape determining protein RodA